MTTMKLSLVYDLAALCLDVLYVEYNGYSHGAFCFFFFYCRMYALL